MRILSVALLLAAAAILLARRAETFDAATSAIAAAAASDLRGKVQAAKHSVQRVALTQVSVRPAVLASALEQILYGASPFTVTLSARPKYELEGNVLVVGEQFTVTASGDSDARAAAAANAKAADALAEIVAVLQRLELTQ